MDGERKKNENATTRACSGRAAHPFPHSLCFLSLLLYKVSTKLIQKPVKFFFFFFFFCGQEILDPTRLFSSVSLSQTPAASVMSWSIQESSYLANRQIAKSVKLVGVLFSFRMPRPARTGRSQKPMDSEAVASHLGIVPRILQVPN